MKTFVKRVYFKLKRLYKRQLDVCKYKRNLFLTINNTSNDYGFEFPPIIVTGKLDKECGVYILKQIFSHHFDILGSGPLNYSSRSDAGSDNIPLPIVRERLNYNYRNINWHIDVMTGHIWDDSLLHSDFNKQIGKLPGVDIKRAWELGRLQHLPQLIVLSQNLGDSYAELAVIEFKNQLKDFMSNNPVGMGVNWACPMDCSIRVVNIIIGLSLLRGMKEYQKSVAFETMVINYIEQHVEFISTHLEKNVVHPEFNNNHYFSNLAGLIFCGVFFKKIGFAFSGLDKYISDFALEFDNQFNSDGSNFESSTSYHRLSGEIAIFTFAYIMGEFGTDYLKRLLGDAYSKLCKIDHLTTIIQRPNGEIVQYGDNDSGRFISISAKGNLLTKEAALDRYQSLKIDSNSIVNEKYFDVNCLDHRDFLDCVKVLFGESNGSYYESTLIRKLANGKVLERNFNLEDALVLRSSFSELPFYEKFNGSKRQFTFKHCFDSRGDKYSIYHLKDFGLVALISESVFFTLYVGDIGQNGKGGHAHCDFGAVELWNNNTPIYLMAGTYCYTSNLELRDKYRKGNNNGIKSNEYSFDSPFSCSRSPKVDSARISLTSDEVSVSLDRFFISIHLYRDAILINSTTDIDNSLPYSNGYGKMLGCSYAF